jgi:hypothetical protein
MYGKNSFGLYVVPLSLNLFMLHCPMGQYTGLHAFTWQHSMSLLSQKNLGHHEMQLTFKSVS